MFELRKLAGLLAEPTVFSMCLAFVGAVFAVRRRARLSIAFVACGVVILWLCSTRWFVAQVFTPLEYTYPPFSMTDLKAQALRGKVVIVVLGGGHRSDCAQSDAAALPRADERVQWAAAMYRALPSDSIEGVLVSGDGGGISACVIKEADAMAAWLVALGVPDTVIKRERVSRTTAENARESLRLLATEASAARTIYVVTSADHMRRAMAEFESALRTQPGLRDAVALLPAPVSAETSRDTPFSWRSLVPNARALQQSTRAIKEWVGWWVLSWRD